MIKFNRYHVTDGKTKVKVQYSLDNRIDMRKCVTIYEDGYDMQLGKLLTSYRNESDMMTDYFDKGKAVLFEGDPLYAQARAKVEEIVAKRGW